MAALDRAAFRVTDASFTLPGDANSAMVSSQMPAPLAALLIGPVSARPGVALLLRNLGFVVQEFETVPALGPFDAGLVVLTADHPDQFPSADVNRLLATAGAARIVCVGSPWCVSMNRTRGIWPLAAVVEEDQLPERLQREREVLLGRLAPLPMTAGREEIAAWTRNASLPSQQHGRRARIRVRDREYRDTLKTQFADAGFSIVDDDSQSVDLTVFDRHDPAACSSLAFDGTTALVGDMISLTNNDFPSGQAIPVSRLDPMGVWRRRLGFAAILMSAALLGCDAKSGGMAGAVSSSASDMKTWAEQIKDIQARKTTSIVVHKSVTTPDWELIKTNCGAIEVLDLQQPNFPEHLLQQLWTLPKIRRLVLGGKITDEGAKLIAGCPTLAEVNLSNADLTDAGVKALCELPLTQLRLNSPRVTEAAMADIARLKDLRFLHLINVPITDAALPTLAQLTKLESLYLDGAKCTDEGLSNFIKGRPDIHFHRDQTHLKGDPKTDNH